MTGSRSRRHAAWTAAPEDDDIQRLSVEERPYDVEAWPKSVSRHAGATPAALCILQRLPR